MPQCHNICYKLLLYEKCNRGDCSGQLAQLMQQTTKTRKLQDAQAEKLTSSHTDKLTSCQADKMTRLRDDRMTIHYDMKSKI